MRKTVFQRLSKRGLTRRGWPIAAACVALAVGGIVLLKAPGHAAPPSDAADWLHSGQSAGPHSVTFEGPALSGSAALTQGAVAAFGSREVLADVRLAAAEDALAGRERQPVALVVVMDVSGSMAGEKIEQARTALRQLVERMRDEDQVAIITYNHATNVIQPLAPVGQVRSYVTGQVAYIHAGGGTIIPSALERGAMMLDAAPAHLVRRMVLLSDGLDGSGQSVEMVSATVRNRAARGMSLSSLGIGVDYDERFMTAVADAGRGNYEFLATGGELQRFLHRELDQAGTTVVDSVTAELALPRGWRVTRAYGAEIQPNGTTVHVPIGPMFAGDRRRVVLALQVDAGAPGSLGAAAFTVRYRTVTDQRHHTVAGGHLALDAVESEQLALETRDATRYAESQAVVIDDEQRRAVDAWRSGDIATARSLSQRNAQQLRTLAAEAPEAAPVLQEQAAEFEADGDAFDSLSAGSAEGRAFGLERNAARRARSR